MSGYPVFRGTINGFRGFRIEKDLRVDTVINNDSLVMPLIRSNALPEGMIPSIGGAIAYDVVTERPYYSDGYTWFPIAGSATTNLNSFGFLKDGNQTIPNSGITGITSYTTIGSTTYRTIPQWDLTTGIYTATAIEDLNLSVTVTWASGVTNQGKRFLYVQHRPTAISPWTTVKVIETQADPDIASTTTQEGGIALRLDTGEQVRVASSQNSVLSIPISGGMDTIISGFRFEVS